jgi:hypothetical protein
VFADLQSTFLLHVVHDGHRGVSNGTAKTSFRH